ncbi:MAG TPA: MFS transporter, partial [Candidatus Kryptobacter bacterium]|nr:MFS transporter [Candidatus Kryptobacter bacterium]
IAHLMMRRADLRIIKSKVQSTMKEGIKEGVSFAVNEPAIASILIVLIFVGTFGYNFNTILPLLVRFVMKGGPEMFGVLTAALGIGSMMGALLVAGRQKPTRKFIYVFALAFGLVDMGISFSRHYTLTIVLLLALGLASIAYIASTNTSLQMNSPMRLRGRIMGLYVVIFAGSTPIGALFTGFMADWIGTARTIFVEGLLCVIGVASGAFYVRNRKKAGGTAEKPHAVTDETGG